jgi:hypothetical protein
VEESYIPIRNEVIFAPPDKGGIVGVMIGNVTPGSSRRSISKCKYIIAKVQKRIK